MEEIVVTHVKDCEWKKNDLYGNLRWKYLVDNTQSSSHGLSCGILKIPVSGELKLHHHDPQEIYLIRSGEALLLKSDGHTEKVFKDSVIYIPMGFSHGLKNIGNSFLELLWIFPTNCWNEVEYQFEA